jgi:hypothetical protein
MSVTINWNVETDLTLLGGVPMKPNSSNTQANNNDNANPKQHSAADCCGKTKYKKASGKGNNNIKTNTPNKNMKINKETKDNVIISGNANSSMASAVLEARFLYLNRNPDSFSNVPVDPASKQLRKRHCIRFVGNEQISADCISKLPASFFVSPTCTSFNYSDVMQHQQHPSQLSSRCTIVDCVNYENEWWIYAQSSKPTKTFIVCNFIYEVCRLKEGCFFTDEIPGGRDQVKRYEYTKLQHFKHCIRELQAIAHNAVPKNCSAAADLMVFSSENISGAVAE